MVRWRSVLEDADASKREDGREVYEMIRRLCAQIPGPRHHMVTDYGWHSHRARGERRKAAAVEGSSAPEVEVRTPTA